MKEHDEFARTANQEVRDDAACYRVTLEDGSILEIYSDLEKDQVRRYYIRNQEGEIISFDDPERYENPSQENIHIMREYLAKHNYFLADEDVKRILQVMREREFHRPFDEDDVTH